MTRAPIPDETGPIRYPDVEVQLIGGSGNAAVIMGAVSQGLRRAGVGQEEIIEYRRQSMAGDYDELLRTAMRWVQVS
jgi:hypothetical protein